jgi:hypothetical protein
MPRTAAEKMMAVADDCDRYKYMKRRECQSMKEMRHIVER